MGLRTQQFIRELSRGEANGPEAMGAEAQAVGAEQNSLELERGQQRAECRQGHGKEGVQGDSASPGGKVWGGTSPIILFWCGGSVPGVRVEMGSKSLQVLAGNGGSFCVLHEVAALEHGPVSDEWR